MGKLIRDCGGVMSLRAALRRARELGASVTNNPGTGELRVRFPGIGSVNHNARRKDASRALLFLIRKAEEPVATSVHHAERKLAHRREGWAA